MIEDIVTADRERLKIYADHLTSTLAVKYGADRDLEALKSILSRYDTLLITEPALFAARLTSARGGDFGMPR